MQWLIADEFPLAKAVLRQRGARRLSSLPRGRREGPADVVVYPEYLRPIDD
jgi:hypothetical protein